MKIILFSIYIIIHVSSIYSCSFNTPWGTCSLENSGKSISDNELIKIIKSTIIKINSDYGPSAIDSFFVIVTDDHAILKNYHHWDWSLGIAFNNPDKIILKDPSLSKISKRRFNQVVEHELSHIMLNRIKYHYTIPRWFKEGFAMKIANEVTLNHKIKVAQNINNKNLFNISQYNQFSEMKRQEFNFAYALSAVYVLSLEKLYGHDINKNIIYNLKQGQPFDKAFYNATKVSLVDLGDIFYVYIKKNFFWLRLINFPKNILSLMPLLLVIGFFIKSYRNKKIKEQWEFEEQLEELQNIDKN